MIKTNLNTQSGRSMIEMLGVLAIVGVLSVGGIAGYSKAMTKFKINKTADQISQIVTNIRTLYAQQTSYEGLGTQPSSVENPSNLSNLGIIPDGLTTSNSYPYLINVFQGSVNIDYWWSFGKTFTVVYDGLPKEACVALATYDWGSPSSSGFIAISIGSGALCGPARSTKESCNASNEDSVDVVACAGNTENPTPMNVATAASACNCGETGCSVGWKFQ